MCDVCHMTRCPSGCPNAPDPPAAFHCSQCDEPIHPGEEYAKIGGIEYCEECIDDMPYCFLVPLLGGEWKTVQEGEAIRCSDCGEPLPAGEEYGIINGAIYCENCIDDIPYCDLVTRMSGEWNTAAEEDVFDGYDG